RKRTLGVAQVPVRVWKGDRGLSADQVGRKGRRSGQMGEDRARARDRCPQRLHDRGARPETRAARVFGESGDSGRWTDRSPSRRARLARAPGQWARKDVLAKEGETARRENTAHELDGIAGQRVHLLGGDAELALLAPRRRVDGVHGATEDEP